MKKRLIVLLVLYSFGGRDLFAQDIPSIQTDRPDQTECPFTVPQGHFQMENGFSIERLDANTKEIAHPSTLLKYGISERFELRLIAEFISVTSAGQNVSGLQPLTVGFKVGMAEEKGIVPTISFIGHLTLPTLASENFRSTYYAPSFRFTMQHSLSDDLALGYNVGAEWDGETAVPVFIYTLTTGYSFSDAFGGFIEIYGFAPQTSSADHRFDFGLTEALGQNFLVDLSAGIGLTENAPKYFVAAGFSFRI